MLLRNLAKTKNIGFYDDLPPASNACAGFSGIGIGIGDRHKPIAVKVTVAETNHCYNYDIDNDVL